MLADGLCSVYRVVYTVSNDSKQFGQTVVMPLHLPTSTSSKGNFPTASTSQARGCVSQSASRGVI